MVTVCVLFSLLLQLVVNLCGALEALEPPSACQSEGMFFSSLPEENSLLCFCVRISSIGRRRLVSSPLSLTSDTQNDVFSLHNVQLLLIIIIIIIMMMIMKCNYIMLGNRLCMQV